MTTHETQQNTSPHTDRALQQNWHGRSSPVGLGLNLVFVGAFFALLALGLSILSSIA